MKSQYQLPFRRMRKSCLPLAGAILFSVAVTGCQWKQCIDDQLAYCEPIDDACAATSARFSAHRAWRQYSHLCIDGDPHKCYFKDGFLDGFCDVATGGDGCLPAIPPRKYWKSCYETEAGRAKICAYFQGYPQGVQAAFELGRARSTRLPSTLPAYLRASCPSCPNPQQTIPAELLDPTWEGGVSPVPPVPESFNDGSPLAPLLPLAPIPNAAEPVFPPFTTDPQ